jgi:hypothetical protein
MWTWGDNHYGRCEHAGPSNIPRRVAGLSRINHIGCGSEHTMAATEDRKVFTWSRSSFNFDPQEVVELRGQKVLALAGGSARSVWLVK